MKSSLSILLLLLTFGCFGQWQNDLDSYFDKLESRDQAMGTVAVTKNGQTVYQRTIGLSSLDPKVKADSNSRYWIGSISKTFTAVIILQMVEDGKITLQDKLSQFFTDWQDADKMTIEQLLRHQSGIYNFGEDRSGRYQNIDPTDREAVLKVFRQSELDFVPGTKAEYNNANYLLLSMIAEEVDSTSFSAILEKRIISPLDLRNTYLKTSIHSGSNEVYSFYWKRGWQIMPPAELTHLKGFGGIVSSPEDLNTFFYALFHQQFFSEGLLKKMITLERGMGMGIFKYPFGEKVCYGHAGNIAGFEAMAAYFPEKEVGFAICLNGSRIPMNEILVEVLKSYYKK